MSLLANTKKTALIFATAFSLMGVGQRPAQALLIPVGGIYVAIAGSVLAVIGGGFLGRGTRLARPPWTSEWFRDEGPEEAGVLPMRLGGSLLAIGMILLDGPSGPRLGYTELSADQREQFGISDAEYEIYESQLEEIAALTDSGTASAVAAGVRTELEAKTHFDREYANLEPETLSVMAKILQANLNAN